MANPYRTALGRLAIIGTLAGSGLAGSAQTGVQPTNDLPNPYQPIANFLKLPEGRTWGSTSAVEIDRDGRSVWVAERCGANTCLNSNLDVVLKFDPSGRLVKSFGAGMLVFPHGIHLDTDGNVWVTDGQDNLPRRRRGDRPDAPLPPPPAKIVGHQVFKFSPDGTLLMTLGRPGGNQPDQPAAHDSFYQPNDVVTAPNGDIFVAEGHGGDNARIVRFARDGTFLAEWGRKGSGRGEYDQPHALAIDSRGRLFVGDRSNNRIVIIDQRGNVLEEWQQFSRPSGLYITKDDTLYVADSESGSVAPAHGAWKRGIRIGSAKAGTVRYLIPDPAEKPASTSAAEGVAVDAQGNVYGAEVGPRGVKRYVKTAAKS